MKHCSECGSKLPRLNPKYCPKCGTATATGASGPAAGTDANSAVQPSGSSRPVEQNNGAKVIVVSVVLSLLIAIILFVVSQSPPDAQQDVFPTVFPSVPASSASYCGDDLCQSGENCASCPGDCGVCHTSAPEPTEVPYRPDVRLVVNYSKQLQGLATKNGWCDYKINPDIPIKTQANAIIPKTGSGSFNYLDNSIAVYKWVKENIQYELGSSSYSSQTDIETLTVRGGKCDEQARLFASLILSVGGIARVMTISECSHAFAEVFFPIANESDKQVIFQKIRQEFNIKESNLYSSNDTDANIRGIWIPFDTAGTTSPGQILAACLPSYTKGSTKFFCPNPCASQPDNLYFYVEKNNCWRACPPGTRTYRGSSYICHACPSDYPFSYSGDPYLCHSCSPSSPWFYNGLCYASCPSGTRGNTDNYCV